MLGLNLNAGSLGVMVHDISACDGGEVRRYITFTNIPGDDSLHGVVPGVRNETTTKYAVQGLFANCWFAGTLIPRKVR